MNQGSGLYVQQQQSTRDGGLQLNSVLQTPHTCMRVDSHSTTMQDSTSYMETKLKSLCMHLRAHNPFKFCTSCKSGIYAEPRAKTRSRIMAIIAPANSPPLAASADNRPAVARCTKDNRGTSLTTMSAMDTHHPFNAPNADTTATEMRSWLYELLMQNNINGTTANRTTTVLIMLA
eukprot:825035-Amphidinium_carterae.1